MNEERDLGIAAEEAAQEMLSLRQINWTAADGMQLVPVRLGERCSLNVPVIWRLRNNLRGWRAGKPRGILPMIRRSQRWANDGR